MRETIIKINSEKGQYSTLHHLASTIRAPQVRISVLILLLFYISSMCATGQVIRDLQYLSEEKYVCTVNRHKGNLELWYTDLLGGGSILLMKAKGTYSSLLDGSTLHRLAWVVDGELTIVDIPDKSTKSITSGDISPETLGWFTRKFESVRHFGLVNGDKYIALSRDRSGHIRIPVFGDSFHSQSHLYELRNLDSYELVSEAHVPMEIMPVLSGSVVDAPRNTFFVVEMSLDGWDGNVAGRYLSLYENKTLRLVKRERFPVSSLIIEKAVTPNLFLLWGRGKGGYKFYEVTHNGSSNNTDFATKEVDVVDLGTEAICVQWRDESVYWLNFSSGKIFSRSIPSAKGKTTELATDIDVESFSISPAAKSIAFWGKEDFVSVGRIKNNKIEGVVTYTYTEQEGGGVSPEGGGVSPVF